MKFIARRPKSPIEEVPPWPQHAETIRIMLIDDDEDEFVLLRETLGGSRGTTFEVDWVGSYGEGLQAIRDGRHHAYLVDYRLGALNGVDLVREARASGSHAPLIMLTGEGTVRVDVEAMEAGATDFLEKGKTPPVVLERTIRYAITQAATTEALRRALRQVSGIEQLGRRLAEYGPIPEVLEEAVYLVTEEFWADAASVYLMDGSMLRIGAARGYDAPLDSIDPASGRLARIIESGRPQVVGNVTVDPEERSSTDPRELCLPLMAEGTCWGVLNVGLDDADKAGEEAQRGLRLVADRLAVAIALNRAIRGRSFVAAGAPAQDNTVA